MKLGRRLKTASRDLAVRTRRTIRADKPTPIFVLGHQKSGTSAIAALLGAAAGVEVTIDLTREIRDLRIPRIAIGEETIESLIRSNRSAFAATIVKHPNLTLIADQLRERFPQSPFVFVVRDPRDTFRSIFDRLGLPGTSTHIDGEAWSKIPRAWQLILGGEPGTMTFHLTRLCDRWNEMSERYWSAAPPMILVRYEEFLGDKVGIIQDLARQVGLPATQQIDGMVDHPFQPAGEHGGVDPALFFGPNYVRIIEDRCAKAMASFGYGSGA